jgi:hypothetical protein
MPFAASPRAGHVCRRAASCRVGKHARSDSGDLELAKAFFSRAAKVVEIPWTIAAATTCAFPRRWADVRWALNRSTGASPSCTKQHIPIRWQRWLSTESATCLLLRRASSIRPLCSGCCGKTCEGRERHPRIGLVHWWQPPIHCGTAEVRKPTRTKVSCTDVNSWRGGGGPAPAMVDVMVSRKALQRYDSANPSLG